MCLGCYAEARFPKIVTPATLALGPLADRVYEFSGTGGNLHIYLDDWNLDDTFFEDAEMKVYYDGDAEQLAAERTCYAALRAMSEDERASAMALWNGFLRPDGTLAPDINEADWLAQVEADEAE